LTVEPAIAEPMIFGPLLFAGEGGLVLVSVGVAVAVESSTYVIVDEEQADVFPAASVAVARKVVVESSVTDTERPGEAKLAALPWAATPPVQSEVV
jgi:hypothetical protein